MITENSVAGWTGIIADLSAKHQTTLDHIEELRAEKRSLALDASMGIEDAKKRLTRINADLNKLALEIDEIGMALQQANTNQQKSVPDESAAKQQEREHRLRDAVVVYATRVNEIDDAIRLLVARFAAAKQALDRAESLMTADERVPIQQLRSLFGPTLAAAHAGLGDFIELGRSAGQIDRHTAAKVYCTKPPRVVLNVTL